jgi:hypothetical protein
VPLYVPIGFLGRGVVWRFTGFMRLVRDRGSILPAVACAAERRDLGFDDGLKGLDDGADQLDGGELVGMGGIAAGLKQMAAPRGEAATGDREADCLVDQWRGR